jgi:hypothetical protein
MKFVGFIKEFGTESFAKDLEEYYLNIDVENTYRQDIIQYIENGVMCVPFMGLVEDADEELMGHLAVATDGEWFWPEYFVNYLKKYPNFKVEEEFVQHVLNNRGKKIEISEEQNLRLEKEFYKIAGFK